MPIRNNETIDLGLFEISASSAEISDSSDVIIPEIVDDSHPKGLSLDKAELLARSAFAEEDEYVSSLTEYNSVKLVPRIIQTTSVLSVNAQRLLRTVIGLIGDKDKPGKVYTFAISDFMKLYGLSAYPSTQITKAGIELGERFLIPDPENPARDGLVLGWLDTVQVKDGIVTVKFQPDLFKVYKAMKSLSSYNLGNTKDFHLNYTFPFYERCVVELGSDSSVEFYMSLESLWSFFQFDTQYKKKNGDFEYSNFKRRVLKKIEIDINGSDKDKNPCNINISFKERKNGRKVDGVLFSVVRVSFDLQAPEKVSNPFYDKLHPETKILYDAALMANINASDIETAIIRFGEDGFVKTMEYNLTKNKDKGEAYWLACIRNGWQDNSSNNRFSFANIEKSVRFAREAYHDYDLFVRSLDEPHVSKLFRYISKVFGQDKPQLYEYMKRTSQDKILENSGFMIFILEVVGEIMCKESPKEFFGWFVDWENTRRSSRSSSTLFAGSGAPVLPEKKKSAEPVLDIRGREKVVALLNSEGINDKTIIASMLEHTDDYISANVEYCVHHYRDKKRQADISGAIIVAVKQDYAGFNAAAARKIKAKKEMEAAVVEAQKVADFEERKDSIDEDELKLLINDFSENSSKKLRELAKEESERRKRDAEIKELRNYFFGLDDMDRSDVMWIAKDINAAAYEIARKTKRNYDEMWDSPAVVGLLVKATQRYRKQQPKQSKPAGSIEELNERLGREQAEIKKGDSEE